MGVRLTIAQDHQPLRHLHGLVGHFGGVLEKPKRRWDFDFREVRVEGVGRSGGWVEKGEELREGGRLGEGALCNSSRATRNE